MTRNPPARRRLQIPRCDRAGSTRMVTGGRASNPGGFRSFVPVLQLSQSCCWAAAGFCADLNGTIYLADFDNRRKLIEDKKELVNSDLEALSRLVLYVIRGGKKPFEKISTKDVATDSPDYEEALDLVKSLGSHDERGLEGLSKHPFFWSKQIRFNFLKNIWNKIKDCHNQETIFKNFNTPKGVAYLQWTLEIDKEVLQIMENPEGRKYKYRNGVQNLLRFIRNLDEHPQKRISEIIGDHADYFLTLFPALTIDVYNYLRKHPTFSHLADIQDPSLS